MIDLRPTLEAPDDDPYLWLEEIDGERALAWVESQNPATLARFGDARFAADREALAAIFDRPDNIPLIANQFHCDLRDCTMGALMQAALAMGGAHV